MLTLAEIISSGLTIATGSWSFGYFLGRKTSLNGQLKEVVRADMCAQYRAMEDERRVADRVVLDEIKEKVNLLADRLHG